ncbi:hypothetical protein M404DRAFT_36574 [Pisolithus tinctorius Marx 270]|uniref:Uncharacterized protein n=1 Tax=Pisolithus tinctorius Marx 270 TaxID=870435 RepID=A0A0C3NAJ6_PISTI|nr:hypothetical protein M404DRAFT_36578 [Pisolithus tinctorius Marx 270]KIN92935.1 hypothetical protein M404DRAFT_36574 [Pisolithus tinctorius Marx 270]
MYHLAIPAQWKLHNVFHASLLSPYCENDIHGPNFPAPPPDLINEEEEYEVEAIVDENSPLDLVYHATIQALRLEELSRYVNRQNPLLSPAHTILNEITAQQVPLLLKLFDVLGGADLIYNVCQYPTLIAPPPPGSRRPSTATSPLASSMSTSPPVLSLSSSRSSCSSHSL